MAMWPCQNPACKSHGRPHPNCKCPAPMAEGGKASHYCSENRAHQEGCEYFADGGEAQGFDWNKLPEAPAAEAAKPEETKGFDWDKIPTAPGENTHEKYGGLGQQLLTGVEGIAQGVAGPLATAAELGLSKLGVPGLEAKDIAARQAENPISHGVGEAVGLAGGLFTGMSEANLIAKGVARVIPEAATVMGKIGSAAIKGAIETGMIQGGDEISKALLGQGDPEAPVSSALANMGATALYGGSIGGIFGAIKPAASKGAALLEKIENDKINSKLRSFMAGIGAASKGHAGDAKEFKEISQYLQPKPATSGYVRNKANLLMTPAEAMPDLHDASFNAGMKVYKVLLNKGTMAGAEAVGSAAGGALGSMLGGEDDHHSLGAYLGVGAGLVAGKAAAPYIEKILGKAAGKYATPILLKAISTGEATTNMVDLLKHAKTIARGHRDIANGVEGLFKYGGQQVYDGAVSDSQRSRLKQFIEDGEQNQQLQQPQDQQPEGYALGGAVKPPSEMISQPNSVAQQYPEQDMMLQTAKGRINNYLNSVRPQPPVGKLPFDSDIKDKKKERSYDKALDLAIKPLSILNHVKDGSLSPEHMQHFTKLYPELHGYLSKKMTEKITQDQMKEQRPSYKLRQSLSMFLGTPLDSTMTPMAIQAAQSVYAQKRANQAQAPEQKVTAKGAQALSKAPQAYKTSGQALETRQQRSK